MVCYFSTGKNQSLYIIAIKLCLYISTPILADVTAYIHLLPLLSVFANITSNYRFIDTLFTGVQTDKRKCQSLVFKVQS